MAQRPARGDRRADLLAVAATHFVDRGIRATTMEDIARGAGAGKATLYRYFANKDAVVDALLEREAARFGREVAAAVERASTGAPARLEAAFVAGVAFFVHHPLLSRGREEDPGLLLDRITASGGPLVATGLDLFADLVAEGTAAGELRAVDPRAAAEVVVRLLLSYVSFPPMHVHVEDPDEARRFARALIAGGLRRTPTPTSDDPPTRSDPWPSTIPAS